MTTESRSSRRGECLPTCATTRTLRRRDRPGTTVEAAGACPPDLAREIPQRLAGGGQGLHLEIQPPPQPESDIRDLLAALRPYGPNTLLWLAQCDAEHPAGTVDDVGSGLFKGYMTRFAPYDRAYEIALDFVVCHVCARLSGDPGAACMPITAPASRARCRRLRGWVDGLIDDRLGGWCWRNASPDPVLLELIIDGEHVATFVAMVPT